MDNDNEPCDSIIPDVVLDAALAGKEIPRYRKKRLSPSDPDLNVDESSDDEKQIKSKAKRSSLKQSSLGAFFTMPSRGERWTPLHRQLSPKKKITIRKKRIAIDTPGLEKAGKISSVVTEDQTRKEGGDPIRRKSPTTTRKDGNDPIKQISATTTNQRQKNGGSEAFVESPGAINPCETRSESTHSVRNEIVELDSLCRTSPSESPEVEFVCEVPSSSVSPYPNKRLCYSTPRISHNRRNQNWRKDIKTPETTPRRKPSQQKSFSPLHFVMEDEESSYPETPVIRRRRCGIEKSIFNLHVCTKEVEIVLERSQQQCPSSTADSPTTNMPEMYVPKSSSSSTLDDEGGSNGSIELLDETAVPSSSTSYRCENQLTKKTPVISCPSNNRTEKIGGFKSRNIFGKEESRTFRNADVSFHDDSVEYVNDGDEGSIAITRPKSMNDELEIVQVGPSKSRSLSTVLYSPRKMELNNAQRLKTILAKARNNFEYLPNLRKPLSDFDYCAFDVPSISNDRPPMSSPEICEDADLNFGNPTEFVRLPWSTANIVSGFHRYIIIDRALRALVHDGAHCIEAVIVTLRQCAPWLKSYDGLLSFMDTLSPYEEREVLDVIAGIAKLAVNAKFILTSPVPLLRANRSGSVTLSQEQCACLLAHAFFCTYRRERLYFNRINMASILDGRNPMSHVKLRFFLHYFSLVLKKMPTGCVSFRREALSPNLIPNWEEEQALMPLMATASDSAIEDSYGCLQVDFANEYIGGGVLNWGAVQEEIRFLICPEMVVSCLLCEKMGPLEVIHIVGAQRYSSYVGYGETLHWAPYEEFGSEPRDEFCRVKCDVVAMDATLFKPNCKRSQYDKVNIDRELNKAYIGFMSTQREVPPIATGNWGCGVFGGDKELKIMIQLIAAARAGRDMIYYTFGSPSFADCVNEQYEKMVHKKASIGAIYKALTSYQKENERNQHISVFDHVYAILSEISCTAS